MLQRRTVSTDREGSDEEAGQSKHDKRRFNRGASQRRSYTNEEKLSVVQMRDSGLTYEAIAEKTGFSRVNMEKWCSLKGREVILEKARKWAQIALLTSSAVKHEAQAPAKQVPSSKKATAPGLTRSVSDSDDQRTTVAGIKRPAPATHTSTAKATPTLVQPRGSAVPRMATPEVKEEEQEEDQESGADSSEAEGECAAVLNLVAGEKCKERQLRRKLRSGGELSVGEAMSSQPQLSRRGSARLPGKKTIKAIGNFEIDLPRDKNLQRQFVKSMHAHGNAASDITMTISDAMLKVDYFPTAAVSARTGSSTASAPAVALFGMSTAVQATRPIVAGTKFFSAINNFRKKTRAAQGIVTRSRPVEGLNMSDDDSEQEKEDSAMMELLGE